MINKCKTGKKIDIKCSKLIKIFLAKIKRNKIQKEKYGQLGKKTIKNYVNE